MRVDGLRLSTNEGGCEERGEVPTGSNRVDGEDEEVDRGWICVLEGDGFEYLGAGGGLKVLLVSTDLCGAGDKEREGAVTCGADWPPPPNEREGAAACGAE
jgi:hypothetical protein